MCETYISEQWQKFCTSVSLFYALKILWYTLFILLQHVRCVTEIEWICKITWLRMCTDPRLKDSFLQRTLCVVINGRRQTIITKSVFVTKRQFKVAIQINGSLDDYAEKKARENLAISIKGKRSCNGFSLWKQIFSSFNDVNAKKGRL